MIWQEKRPLRGKIRRAVRGLRTMDHADLVVSVSVVFMIGAIILSIMCSLGEYPSSPVAGLSTHPRDHIRSPSSRSGRDPYKIVSRVDHGQVVEVYR